MTSIAFSCRYLLAMMDLEADSESPHEECDVCLSCNKPRRKPEAGDLDQGQLEIDKTKGYPINPLSSKLLSLRQKFDGSNKTGSNSIDCLEKKGLLQRMHSLSLLKPKEKIQSTVFVEMVENCQCDESGETRFRTWPERGRDKNKSPKKAVPEPETQAAPNGAVHVNLILNQLPLAYDPVSKQLRLINIKEESKEEEPIKQEIVGHKRQPSLLSNISSTGSEAHLPLMSLHSKTHSRTSLSSLSNYSSSTGQTNSLERSCHPPRFGLASFWHRAFARKSAADDEETLESSPTAASWKLFSPTNFFQRSSRSGRSSCSSNSPTSTPRNVGSTGLILHSRPSFLPAKRPEEELHHQLLHHKLLEESQRREQAKLLVNFYSPFRSRMA